jgi:hypothetical protein
MLILKKLLFVVPFLIFYILFLWGSQNLINSPYSIIFFDLSFFQQLFFVLIFLTLSSLFFVIFATIASDIKYSLGLAFLSSLLPLVVVNNPYSSVLSLSLMGSFALVSLLLQNKLKTYLNFQPTSLLSSSVRNLTTLTILSLTLLYFFSIGERLKTEAVRVPESFVNTIASLPQVRNTFSVDNPITEGLQSITTKDLEMLRQNPTLLKQHGLDESIIDEIVRLQQEALGNKTQISKDSSSQIFLKALINNQVQQVTEPIKGFLPLILSLVFFVTLHSLASIVSLIIFPLLYLIFQILEKTGFTKFVVEKRDVKKLVV